jgi:hypothetical protein
VVRDALFVASPDLDESLEVWMREPDSGAAESRQRSSVLFADGRSYHRSGCSPGHPSERSGETRLILEVEKYRRRSRLDMDYPSLLRKPWGVSLPRQRARYRPNSSLYRAALSLCRSEAGRKNRTHHLVAVEDSQELRATLSRG